MVGAVPDAIDVLRQHVAVGVYRVGGRHAVRRGTDAVAEGVVAVGPHLACRFQRLGGNAVVRRPRVGTLRILQEVAVRVIAVGRLHAVDGRTDDAVHVVIDIGRRHAVDDAGQAVADSIVGVGFATQRRAVCGFQDSGGQLACIVVAIRPRTLRRRLRGDKIVVVVGIAVEAVQCAVRREILDGRQFAVVVVLVGGIGAVAVGDF